MRSLVIQGFFPHGAGRTMVLPAPLASFPRSGGQPLAPTVQRSAEAAFRTSFADVRVFVGREAASLGALAFTNGSNIYFAPGQYDPHGAHGRRVLWHELTHVMQQKSGRVRNPFGAAMAVVHDRLLEAEAERMSLGVPVHRAPVQRKSARGGVVQPLLMYMFQAGTLMHTSYTDQQAADIGKVAVTHLGVTVFADRLNVDAAKREIERRMAFGTLTAVPGEDELQICDEGFRPVQGADLYILRAWHPEQIARGAGVFVAGKVFYRVGQGPFHHATEALVNRYWDSRYGVKFRRVTRPDWRYNCGDYALSIDGKTSIENEGTYLAANFELLLDLKKSNAEAVEKQLTKGGSYVCRLGYHYFRIEVHGAHADVSQKDGDSAVYATTMTLENAAAYCFERVPASEFSLYRRK